MSSLRQPALGPIVGHTTHKSCCLWIRGGDPEDNGSVLAENRRTIGVITVLDHNGKPAPEDPARTNYFRLHREYDRTGVFTLGEDSGLEGMETPFKLKSNTTYRARMGVLVLDDPFDNDLSVSDEELARRLPPPSVWTKDLLKLPPEYSEAVFTTFPRAKTASLSFLIGSCHYPGLLWKKKHSDRIFGPMNEFVHKNPHRKKPKFVLMVGDQIYADMFNRHVPVGLADTYKEFQERYHDAFGARNIRRLLRSAPHYMILDDHEIEDNWTQDRILERKKRVLFNLAVGAYMSYQWIHGPKNYDGRIYYSFRSAGFPFFVLDVRTQRYKDDVGVLTDNHLLGRPSFDPENEPTQIDHLCRWLTENHERDPDRPKFIVSPGVFVPNPVLTTRSDEHKDKSDSWPAFPETRRRLLSHIVHNGIQNVVFLSGDIHCSNVAEIRFSGSSEAEKIKAFSITSSAFYWPFWFADGEPSNYVHNSKSQNDTFDIDGKVKMDYVAYNFTQKDNFCQVDVNNTEKKIEVRVIDREGKQIVKSNLKLA